MLPAGWVWTCTCHQGGEGFPTEDDAANEATLHVKAQAWQTLTEAVEQAERADPAVAEAAASLDAAIDDLNYQAALRRFRPLPWDG